MYGVHTLIAVSVRWETYRWECLEMKIASIVTLSMMFVLAVAGAHAQDSAVAPVDIVAVSKVLDLAPSLRILDAWQYGDKMIDKSPALIDDETDNRIAVWVPLDSALRPHPAFDYPRNHVGFGHSLNNVWAV